MGCRVADEHDELHPQFVAHRLDGFELVLGIHVPQGVFVGLASRPARGNGRPLAGIGQVDDHVVDAGLLDRGKDRAGLVDVFVIVIGDPLVAYLELDDSFVRAAAANQDMGHRDGAFGYGGRVGAGIRTGIAFGRVFGASEPGQGCRQKAACQETFHNNVGLVGNDTSFVNGCRYVRFSEFFETFFGVSSSVFDTNITIHSGIESILYKENEFGFDFGIGDLVDSHVESAM